MRLGRANRMWVATLLGGCILPAVGCKRETGEAERAAIEGTGVGDSAVSPAASTAEVELFPEWAVDARWYYIDVPRFHNGDRSSDPARTLPWSTDWPVGVQADGSLPLDQAGLQALRERRYGGDVEGVRQRLPYLRELGVNALLLDRALPRSSTPDADDAALVELVREAHAQGFHVVLRAASLRDSDPSRGKAIEQEFFAEALRWMDPDGDGDPSDGVDGWSLDPGTLSPQRLQRFRQQITDINPQALLLVRRQPFRYLPVASLFLPERTSEREKLLAGLGGDATFRAELGTLSELHAAGYSVADDSERDAQWRLATVFLHFYPGAPVTAYGDEVGMFRGAGAPTNPPMWWNDLPDSGTKSPDYRGDFYALVRWLHSMRAEHAPLRRGACRAILLDESKKILAFARSVPGEEVALAINFGDTKQKVMLPVGKPGQLVYVLSPAVDPERAIRFWKRKKCGYDPAEIHRLPVGGSKQFVNREGKIRLWVKPMSVRVVLVFD
ncbi:MAG: hypothetical protein IIB59_00425 [Planctomycetes bacterium]|nr:hypothetical protein [Planctomycetota bacterium]